MAIDVRRGLRAALEAALEQPAPPSEPKKRHLPVGSGVLLGAGLVTAGRLVANSVKNNRSGSQTEQNGGADDEAGHEDFEDEEDEEPEAEEDEDFDDEDEPRPKRRRSKARSRA